MLSTDKPEFEIQLSMLCQGYGFWTGDRLEAYWKGLAKMSIVEFARCVEFSLSEDGPEKIPNVHGIWNIRRQLKAPPAQRPVAQIAEQDHLLYFANRLFFRHLVNRQGLGSIGTMEPPKGMTNCNASPELLAGRKVVLDLVDYFYQPVLDGDPDATPYEFVTQLVAGLKRVGEVHETMLAGWRKMITHPDARIPFGSYMARTLHSVAA